MTSVFIMEEKLGQSISKGTYYLLFSLMSLITFQDVFLYPFLVLPNRFILKSNDS